MRNFLIMILVPFSLSTSAFAESTLPPSDMANLQASVQSFIEQNSVDGAFLQLDNKTGETTALYPAKAHPMIMTLGDKFVLCSELRDSEGKNVNVDFYLAKSKDKFVVFATHFGPHPELEALAASGKAAMVN